MSFIVGHNIKFVILTYLFKIAIYNLNMGLFGFGDVKIELDLPSMNIQPNSEFKGTAILTLNKDINAKGVIARLFAQKMVLTPMARNMRVPAVVYQEQKNLDIEKTYLKQNSPIRYDFNFSVPAQSQATTSSNPPLFSPLEGLKSPEEQPGPVKWYIEVKFDIPHALEVAVSKSQELNMST